MQALSRLERDDKGDFAGKIEVVHTFDKYPVERRPVADTTYIPEMAAEGYVIITADHAQKAIRGKKAAESQAYRDANAIAFWLPKHFVNPGKKCDEPGEDYKFLQAAKLFEWWPRIKWKAGRASPGELFDLDDKGKIIDRD